MRTILRRIGCVITVGLVCAASTLPSCASMGGGGMKGMFAEPASTSTQAVSM